MTLNINTEKTQSLENKSKKLKPVMIIIQLDQICTNSFQPHKNYLNFTLACARNPGIIRVVSSM